MVATLMLLLGVTVLAAPAAALEITDRGTDNLDGRVIMGPASERIETVNADGGDLVGPGTTVRRSIILTNFSKRSIDFQLVVSDVVGSATDLGIDIRHGVREAAAGWVTLEQSSLTLEPGQQGTLTLTVRIPDEVTPGSKSFAVTATQQAAAAATEGGTGIAPTFAQSSIFVVELPGDAKIEGGLVDASITSVQKSTAAGRAGDRAPKNPRTYVGPGWTDRHDLRLTATYENTGERLLSPTGRVTVKDIFGRTAGRYDVRRFSVYPGGKVGTSTKLTGLPSLGLFQVTVELESAAAGKQTTTLPRFMLLPRWFVAALGAVLVYLLVRIIRWRLRRRQEWRRFLDEEERVAGASSHADDVDPDLWDEDDDPEPLELHDDVR